LKLYFLFEVLLTFLLPTYELTPSVPDDFHIKKKLTYVLWSVYMVYKKLTWICLKVKYQFF